MVTSGPTYRDTFQTYIDQGLKEIQDLNATICILPYKEDNSIIMPWKITYIGNNSIHIYYNWIPTATNSQTICQIMSAFKDGYNIIGGICCHV